MTLPTVESGQTGHWHWKQLKAGGAMAEVIPARGGIVTRWEIERDGQPLSLLWLRSDYYDQPPGVRHLLGGGIPLLFPVSGPTASDGEEGRYLVDGKPFKMDAHGFGPWAEWAVVNIRAGGDSAAIGLATHDTPATRERYPFAFRSEIRYTLRARTLRIEWSVENASDSVLPLAPGLHPYFHVPFTDKGRREDAMVLTTASQHYITNEPVRVWSGKTEPLKSGALRVGDVPAVGRPYTIGDYAKPEFTLQDKASGVSLRATWPAPTPEVTGPYLNLWTPDMETPTFCVEPFLGLQNVLNNRRGLIEIAPGKRWDWWFEMVALI